MDALKLCYKEYPLRDTLGAFRKYEEACGGDLESDLYECVAIWLADDGLTKLDKFTRIGKAIGRKKAALAIWCLANAENNLLTLSEIEDATFRAGFLDAEPDEWNQPWPMLTVLVGLRLSSRQELRREDAKREAGIKG